MVWGYAFAAAAIGAVATWAPDLDSPWHWLAPGAKALAGGIALVWFARQASRFSLGHAFLLIGLSTAVQGSGTIHDYLAAPWIESSPGYWLVSLLSILQGLLAVWVLAHLDPARAFPRNAIIGLFVLDGALRIAPEIVRGGSEGLVSAAAMLAFWAVWYGIVILLTYLTRSRQPIWPRTLRRSGATSLGTAEGILVLLTQRLLGAGF